MSAERSIPRPLSHAYIITGGSASSRQAFAKRLTAAYLCERGPQPCGVCRHCRKVAADIHPDVFHLSLLEDKREIMVAQARAMRADVFVQPNEGERKVYLIDPADTMNEESQNALLKVLEDGPAYAAFLLLTANPGRLFSTIRSRCETLALPPEEEAPDPLLAERAHELARRLLEDDEPTLWAFLCTLEREKWKSRELQGLFSLTEEALRPFLHAHPRRCAELLRLLRRLEDACFFNVGAGHLLGLLCTERPHP